MALTTDQEAYVTSKLGELPFTDHELHVFHMKTSLMLATKYLYEGETSKFPDNCGNITFYDEDLEATVFIIASEPEATVEFVDDTENRVISGLGS